MCSLAGSRPPSCGGWCSLSPPPAEWLRSSAGSSEVSSPDSASYEAGDRPDRGDEPDPGHHEAASDRRTLELPFLRGGRGLDEREHVSDEECSSHREHEIGEELVTEEHARAPFEPSSSARRRVPR